MIHVAGAYLSCHRVKYTETQSHTRTHTWVTLRSGHTSRTAAKVSTLKFGSDKLYIVSAINTSDVSITSCCEIDKKTLIEITGS